MKMFTEIHASAHT